MSIPISVLDIQWPGHLSELVPTLDRMGYHRYWATEHYGPLHSASPAIVAALAAGLSNRLRIGTGGVLLRYTSALRVAQDFATLELFFPGRLDLGVAGAGAGHAHEMAYGRDVRIADDDAYVDRLRRLAELVRIDEKSPTPIGPALPTKPQLWLCGTSLASARTAASLGLRFAFHHYLSSMRPGRPSPSEVGRVYRGEFVPRMDCGSPYLAVAAYGACGITMEMARGAWAGHASSGSVAAPSFVGTPEDCAGTLDELWQAYGASELFVDCFSTRFESRVSGLGALVTAWHAKHQMVADP